MDNIKDNAMNLIHFLRRHQKPRRDKAKPPSRLDNRLGTHYVYKC